ncbi:MAG: hypothetical protein IKB75_02400 [Clostridia bacterium]|nr:hypothetical protein [Clostridia bacterium]
MRHIKTSRGRRRRAGILLLMLVLCATFLVSCVAGSGTLWVKSLLGTDTPSYRAEAVLGECEIDGALAGSLEEIVEMLVLDSTHLSEFDSTGEVAREYRDVLLNALLCKNYSLYTGNATLLSKVANAYPHTVVSTAIPAEDFENAVLRYFGGTHVGNGDGEFFSYLSRSQTYTTAICPRERTVEVESEMLEETENTYRLYFHLIKGEERSATYCALFVKRADGSVFLRALEEQ